MCQGEGSILTILYLFTSVLISERPFPAQSNFNSDEHHVKLLKIRKQKLLITAWAEKEPLETAHKGSLLTKEIVPFR